MSYIFKTANYTASAGDQIIADTSGGSFTILLPSSPSSGDWVQIQDQGDSFGAHPLTVGPNGKDIINGNPNFVDSNNGDLVTFVWIVNANFFSGIWLTYQLATIANTR